MKTDSFSSDRGASSEMLGAGALSLSGVASGRDESEDVSAAYAIIQKAGIPSTALVQRKLGVGYQYASLLMHRMEQAGILTAPNAQGVRAFTATPQPAHQSQLAPEDNKFHKGNGDDGKHYWLTPPALLAELSAEFGPFDFDPCPCPLPAGFDGLTCEWGQRNYVNPPFGSIMHEGKKKGPTAWVRKAIQEWQKGKLVVLVYPVDKWLLMLLKAILGEHGEVRNLGDVRWLATEDGSVGKGTGRHIACFVLRPETSATIGSSAQAEQTKE